MNQKRKENVDLAPPPLFLITPDSEILQFLEVKIMLSPKIVRGD